ncbi:sigma 54-interacting transcriptional regulator [Fusibacter bizertensis]|uniref:Sigma 54-interacting transcriptional regulator n=1 Tax=Fusibacter bizertensis TaxID=1488331 RepID=A0ABT6N9P3_9FIRM|nr:sigma 54-interacting transcriptional regulator [Fusibacter bizertensis]MDH8677127.1 sigma 54-interacting transcriptional regulator [Fusibacter bizertensis]
MTINEVLNLASREIFDAIEEGIHIVDHSGKTILYNKAIEEIEGLSHKQVVGRHLLDLFPDWTKENSTLLTVLSSGVPIFNREQSYLNFKGKNIRTLNSTLPIFEGKQLIGAVEIAKNMTTVNDMSEQIINLQQKLIKPNKKDIGIRHYHFDQLIGKNEKYLEAIKIAKRASKSISSVLIFGDTGTGKELFAQSIHYGSERKEEPFIAQNCAAIPESLLEGLLFGTSKGSFTGALDRPGLFEQADGGTLFLDEVNSMSSALQAKILRVLQENYVRRVGGNRDIPIDVRIIAAANEEPEALIKSGQFRKDLYYRLNVINIRIPSLNDRVDDIPLLVDYFIREYNEQLGKDVWMVSSELLEAFKNYNWAGNIRELKNFIESAMNLISDEHVIGKEHMPSHVAEVLLKKNQYIPNSPLVVDDLNAHLQAIEKDIIREILALYNFNISKAARHLKISRQNLQYKIKQFEL